MTPVHARRTRRIGRTGRTGRTGCAVAVAAGVIAGVGLGSAEARRPEPNFATAPVALTRAELSAELSSRRAGAVPRATRGATRTRGPQTVPAAMPNAVCALRLPKGVWKLDLTAARTLTMLTAVAYKESRPLPKAARAFEHSLRLRYRSVPTPLRARDMIRRNEYQRGGIVPRTWAVSAVLALYSPQSLTCRQPIRPLPTQEMLTNGLTLRTQTMIYAVFSAYGGAVLGGFAPGGITSGHIENSAHYYGRAVDVFFPRSDPNNKARGWLLAHWLVAHGDTYSIATVIFDDKVWTRRKSDRGWRRYVHPSGNTQNPTLRHLDHVHVDVASGELSEVPEEPRAD